MIQSSSLTMQQYSIEPRTRKYVKGYGFLLFARKYEKQLLDTGLDSLKSASKKVVHKAGEFIGNKITDAVAKSNDNKILKLEPVGRNNYSTRRKRWNIKQIKTSIIIKMEHYKISKLINDFTKSKFVTKKWIE